MFKKFHPAYFWIVAVVLALGIGLLIIRTWIFPALPGLPVKWTTKLGTAEAVYVQSDVAVADVLVYVISKNIQPLGDSAEEFNFLHALGADSGTMTALATYELYHSLSFGV